MSKIEDPDRFFNWYQGYTKVRYPYYLSGENKVWYILSTSANLEVAKKQHKIHTLISEFKGFRWGLKLLTPFNPICLLNKLEMAKKNVIIRDKMGVGKLKQNLETRKCEFI